MSQRFVICGLPRSGTTIIARFVGGLPGVTVFHEPFQASIKRGISLSLDADTEWVGIKEPFFAPPVAALAALVNSKLLGELRAADWRFVWVLRKPKDVLASVAHTWGYNDGGAFMENIRCFEHFRAGEDGIDYDRFVADPLAEWNRLNPLGIRATEVKLAPAPPAEQFMGDWKAHASHVICRQ